MMKRATVAALGATIVLSATATAGVGIAYASTLVVPGKISSKWRHAPKITPALIRRVLANPETSAYHLPKGASTLNPVPVSSRPWPGQFVQHGDECVPEEEGQVVLSRDDMTGEPLLLACVCFRVIFDGTCFWLEW